MSNLKKSQRSLRQWTKQKWRTKSGKKSSETGERYLPEKAIKHSQKKNTPEQVEKKEKTLKKENNILSNQKKQLEKLESIEK